MVQEIKENSRTFTDEKKIVKMLGLAPIHLGNHVCFFHRRAKTHTNVSFKGQCFTDHFVLLILRPVITFLGTTSSLTDL